MKFAEGQRRFEAMRRHLKHTEKKVNASEAYDNKTKKGTPYSWKKNRSNQD